MKRITAELINPYLFNKSINDSSKVLKYFFSGVVWFTFFYAIYYFVFHREYNYTYSVRNPFVRKKREDDDDIDYTMGV